MKPRAEYTGRKFGLLTVISCVEPSNGNNRGGVWMCKCKCRRFANFSGYQLHSRNSCGCLGRKAAIERGKNNRKSNEEKAIGEAYRRYKRSAISSMSRIDWLIVVSESCHYCGQIDDNQPVMIEGKIGSCCQTCRQMRGDLSHSQFCEYMSRIQLSKK